MRAREDTSQDGGSGTAVPVGGRLFERSTSSALLGAYAFLALGMLRREGTYTPVALGFLLASFACLAVALFWAWRDDRFDRKAAGASSFAFILVVLLLAALRKPAGFFVATANPRFDAFYHAWLLALAVGMLAVHLPPARRRPAFRRGLFAVAVCAAFGFRAWLLTAAPFPQVDTFSVAQESAQHLLEGKNPYRTPVSDVERATLYYGYTLNAYPYLPANLYLQTLAYGLAGDVRWAYVCAEAIVALVLWSLARRHWKSSISGLIGLLFLYHPRSLYVLELGGSDPLILLLFALYLFLRDRGRDGWASAAYGYMLSLKQYLAFFFVQWFFLERRWRQILWGLIVAGLTALPFLIADAPSLFREGMLFKSPFRPDSLTIFGFLWQALGIRPPTGWSFGVGTLVSILLIIPVRRMPALRGYLFAVTITTFSIFLFGSQAFCNYYYLVSGLLMFLIALGGKRPAEAHDAQMASARCAVENEKRR